MSAPNTTPMRWYKKKEFDAPELNSPQPCTHGSACNYTVKDKETGAQKPGCCAFVHPGEEGKGRHFFPERTVKNEDGTERTLPACVRLTGGAGYYERRRLRLSWPAWCEREGIQRPEASTPSLVRAGPKGGRAQPMLAALVAENLGYKTPERAKQRGTKQRGTKPPGAPRRQRLRHPSFEIIEGEIAAEIVPVTPASSPQPPPLSLLGFVHSVHDEDEVYSPHPGGATFDEQALDASQQSPSLVTSIVSDMEAVD